MRVLYVFTLLFICFLFCASGITLAHTGEKCSRAFTSEGTPILWPDYPHRPYDVLKYQLTLDWRKIFETQSQQYSGVNIITLVVIDSTPQITLDAALVKIDSITINGSRLSLTPQPT